VIGDDSGKGGRIEFGRRLESPAEEVRFYVVGSEELLKNLSKVVTRWKFLVGKINLLVVRKLGWRMEKLEEDQQEEYRNITGDVEEGKQQSYRVDLGS
jgi:hypothetical protein